MNMKKEFLAGVHDGVPVCLGYIAVSFAFGIQATQAGLTAVQAVIMSLCNVTSAGQFSSLDLIMNQATLAEMALLQLIINLRYMLMSCALTQKLGEAVSFPKRMLIAYGVTDEIFGISVLRKGKLYPSYSYGLITISVSGWLLGTFLGAACGEVMPQRLISCLGLAIYGMFISIIMPEAREKKAVMIAVIVSMTMSAVMYWAPVLREISSGFRIIIVTIIVASVASILAPIDDRTLDEDSPSGFDNKEQEVKTNA